MVQGSEHIFFFFFGDPMRSQNKNQKTTSRMSHAKRGSGQRSGDLDSRILQKISVKWVMILFKIRSNKKETPEISFFLHHPTSKIFKRFKDRG